MSRRTAYELALAVRGRWDELDARDPAAAQRWLWNNPGIQELTERTSTGRVAPGQRARLVEMLADLEGMLS